MGAGVGVIRTLRTAAIATALLLAAGNAWALGLGQIEVKSRRNQPLVAEIPIISTTPGELEALQARLASPETFRRVGLAPPSGVAADLQFSLGSDARGRPVIRVTSTRPVEQPVLNFLVEVDWGQGRLVREYSALVDAPNTASAPLQPAIEAPVSPAPNVVQRPVAPPVAAAPVPTPPPIPEARPEPAPAPIAIAPLPPPAAPAPIAAAPAPAAAQYGPIKQGETLSKIAGKLDLPSGYSLDQTMLALLRANPDAFLGDDINRLRRGSVLRVPGRDELGSVSADEAGQVVRQQMQQWRQARRPVRQPETATAEAAPATRAPTPAAPAAAPAPRAAATAAKPQPATPPRQGAPARRQEARLQIIPPAAPGKATGTRSGTTAGGEGSMLQQQLRQKDEDIAAKAVEIGELKERVAELEKLKQDQEQLLSLKDSELAAAQQRLAEANKAAATAAAAAVKPAAAQAAGLHLPRQRRGIASEQRGEQLPARRGQALLAVLADVGQQQVAEGRGAQAGPACLSLLQRIGHGRVVNRVVAAGRNQRFQQRQSRRPCLCLQHVPAHALHRGASVFAGDGGQQADHLHLAAQAQHVQGPGRVLAPAPGQQDRQGRHLRHG